MAALGLLVVGGSVMLLYAGFSGAPLVATFKAILGGTSLPAGTSLTSGTTGSFSGATPSTSPDSPQGNLSVMPPAQPGSVTTPGTQPAPGYAPYTPPTTGVVGGVVGGGSVAANQGNPKSPPAPY